MNRRILTLILALSMVLGSISIVSAATGNSKVDWLIDKGLVTGDEGGYRLNDTIRRSEASAMVVRAVEQDAIAASLQSITSRFKDMNLSTVLWARGYVNYVDGQGIVNGYPDGTFGPNRPITYAEIIKILVMVNGDLPDTTGYEGSLWAVPYITKAVEVGITEGVTIPNNDYNANAVREKVFEMVYNTMNKKVQAEQESYKGIVIGNSRVEGMPANQITFIVWNRTNQAGSSHRYNSDSNVRVTLPSSMDAEALLGKVIDLTIDKNNNAVKADIDSSYTYYAGPLSALDDEVVFSNGDTHDVFMENRFNNSIDKIYGSYLNDEEYDYDDFVAALDNRNGNTRYVAEFAKVTVKGNRTFFIDAFRFDDIAPVKEVRKSGEDIYVYDDNNSAAEMRLSLDEVVGYTANGFKSIELSDIKADDVVHVYDGDRAIVRQDAKKSAEFDRVLTNQTTTSARIDKDDYQIRNINRKRPVYSIDGSRYFTLMAASAASSLSELSRQDVSFLVDANGSLQLLKGDVEYSEKVILIDKVSTRNLDAYNDDNSKTNYKTDNFSKFLLAGSTTARSLSDFNRGDISYLFNDGDTINTLVKLATASSINTNAKAVAKNSRGVFDINLSNSRIRVESNLYDVTNSTSMFIVETEGSAITRLQATDLEAIAETARPGSDLRAYVISEKDFSDLNIGNEVRVGNDANTAFIIIFTDYELNDDLVDTQIVQLVYNYRAGEDKIFVADEDERDEEYDVASFANIPNLNANDIVSISLDSSDKVISLTKLIDRTSATYDVIDVDYSSNRLRSITVEISGSEEKIDVSNDVVIFGDSGVEEDNTISFALDADDQIIAIQVLR